MIEYLICRIESINEENDLQISLETIEEIYGQDVILSLVDNAEEVVQNIEYLIHLGFADTVSDICNRFAIILCEDHHIFRARVDQLIQSVGENYADKMGEDMSYWEALI